MKDSCCQEVFFACLFQPFLLIVLLKTWLWLCSFCASSLTLQSKHSGNHSVSPFYMLHMDYSDSTLCEKQPRCPCGQPCRLLHCYLFAFGSSAAGRVPSVSCPMNVRNFQTAVVVLYLNCGKIHIKFRVLAIFKCAFQCVTYIHVAKQCHLWMGHFLTQSLCPFIYGLKQSAIEILPLKKQHGDLMAPGTRLP